MKRPRGPCRRILRCFVERYCRTHHTRRRYKHSGWCKLSSRRQAPKTHTKRLRGWSPRTLRWLASSRRHRNYRRHRLDRCNCHQASRFRSSSCRLDRRVRRRLNSRRHRYLSRPGSSRSGFHWSYRYRNQTQSQSDRRRWYGMHRIQTQNHVGTATPDWIARLPDWGGRRETQR